MSKPGELPIPPAVAGDPHPVELARIWAAGGKLHVTLATGLWDEPFNWGIMLVDLARHVAQAYDETSELSYAQALTRLKEGFDAEWDYPTDEPTGRVD
ncbi:MAG: DUF5076 domain-containing protein [Lacipirellulaceae bacterium]